MSDEKNEELPPPRTGAELAKRIGCALDEGVLVALLPAEIEHVYSKEVPYYDGNDNFCHAVIADCGPWGHRMLDLQAPNGENVKWWRVKEALPTGLDIIPVRWQGPIGEIPERYLESGVTGVRFYQHAPWFFPGSKPVVKSEQAEEQTMTAAIDAVQESISGR